MNLSVAQVPDLGLVLLVVFVCLVLLFGARHGFDDERSRGDLALSITLILIGRFIPEVVALFGNPRSFESMMQQATSGGSTLMTMVSLVSSGLVLFGIWKLVTTCLNARPRPATRD